jgi:hydrogenase maturation protease
MNILVAGIGNIFFGDDAFGVEVVQKMMKRELPASVTVADFGIRGFDLAYAMMDEQYDLTILVDALPRGGDPGTLYTIEPDLKDLDSLGDWSPVDTHGMTPVRVFQLIETMGGKPNRVVIVGCEPQTLGEEEEGFMGLSAPVTASVNGAIEIIESLIRERRL